MQPSIGAVLKTRKAYGQSAQRSRPRGWHVQQETPKRPLMRIGGAAEQTMKLAREAAVAAWSRGGRLLARRSARGPRSSAAPLSLSSGSA